MNKLRITVLSLLSLTVVLLIVSASANNDSMNTEDIVNVKPSIPFGSDLFSQLFAAVKWGSYACFVIGVFATIGGGALGTVAQNSAMSEKAEENMFKLIKILLFGGFVFIAGIFIFETYL